MAKIVAATTAIFTGLILSGAVVIFTYPEKGLPVWHFPIFSLASFSVVCGVILASLFRRRLILVAAFGLLPILGLVIFAITIGLPKGNPTNDWYFGLLLFAFMFVFGTYVGAGRFFGSDSAT